MLTEEIARPGPRRRRPVRGHPRRRAAARGTAAARGHRGGRRATAAARAAARQAAPRPPGPRRRPARWAQVPGGAVVPRARSRRAARPGRPGPRCPARPGRRRSPAPPSRQPAPAGAPSSWFPTPATWPASTRRWPRCVPPASPGDPAAYVTLTAELGPAERYRRWLAALRGEAMIVAGTRAAMFAPVRDLGLVVLWDDGDDLHAEPHAPYPNAREVLALRAHRAGAAALIGGFARTTELTQLVEAGWARQLAPDRQTLRAAAPRVRPAADDKELGNGTRPPRPARLPSLALRTARAGARRRPGPRPGAQARLPRRDRLRPLPRPGQVHPRQAGGTRSPVQRPAAAAGPHATPDCRWCGALATTRSAGRWRCPRCGHDKLRAHHHRRGPHRGGTRPGLPRCQGPHVRRRPGPAEGSRRARPGDRDPGRGAARRLRGRAAARRLGAAVPAEPARGGGDAAPLAGRRRPGAARRHGPGARRRGAARHPGADPLGPGHVRRA